LGNTSLSRLILLMQNLSKLYCLKKNGIITLKSKALFIYFLFFYAHTHVKHLRVIHDYNILDPLIKYNKYIHSRITIIMDFITLVKL